MSYNIKCPNCRMTLVLEKLEDAFKCEHCWEILVVGSPAKEKKQRKKKSNKNLLTARKNIVQYGWSVDEADQMIALAIEKNQLPSDVKSSELVKFALLEGQSE